MKIVALATAAFLSLLTAAAMASAPQENTKFPPQQMAAIEAALGQ